jgi:hypothetical protein
MRRRSHSKTIAFNMIKTNPSTCGGNPSALVIDHSFGEFENLEVLVTGLLPKTDFDLFSIQVPGAPFGLAWYIGDINTDASGNGVGNFAGRFSVETFIVAPGVAPAPVVFGGPFPDASSNPKTNPVQLYHLGLWFNSPSDAVKDGCAGTVTPFNGEHNAGVQILNSANFQSKFGIGPLFFLQ